MKQPDLRNTTNRDEMMCPRCDKEGLEENPAYSDEYQGTSELIKATRCPNEDCEYHYGLPEDEVKRQMPDKSSLNIFENLIPTELDASAIIRICLVFGGIVFMLAQVGLLPFGGGEQSTTSPDVQSNINGQVSGEQLDSLESLSIELRDDSGDVIEEQNVNNGDFSFENINSGTYDVYVYSSELSFSPPGQQIEVGDEDQNIEFELIDNIEPFEINQTVDNSNINLNYENPYNIDDLELTLSPIEGDNIEREHDISSSLDETILVPVTPQSEQIRVNAVETTEEQIINNQYINEAETYDILGNMATENLRLILTEESSSDVQSETFDVEDGDTESIFVSSEETLGSVDITIRNGTSSASEQETGTWDGQENITFFTGLDSFTTANMQIQPEPTENEREITGEITGSTIEPNLQGNMPVDDAIIRFEGGDTDSSSVGSISERDDAESGTTTKEYHLATIEDESRYRLDWDANVIENSNLVDFAYEINGEETTIEEGEDGTGISLDEGDEINFILKLERETVSSDENSPHFGSLDDNIQVNDVWFSNSNPDTGENVEKFASLENEASHDITEEIVFYRNGDDVASRDYTIPSNSEKEIGGINELGSTSMSEEGTNVWYINDRGPFFHEVGNSEPTYGVGEIEGELRDIGSEGEVSIDTNNDGEQDCTVSSETGECSFDTLQLDDLSISVSERNVAGTNYIIEYTEVNNPRDVTVDIGEDNITDLEHNGILTGTESESVEINPGNTTMRINSENNVPVSYSISWQSDAVIDNPVIYHGENRVISDKGTFSEPQTIQIDALPEGENEFRFRSSSGGYSVDIEWVEDEGQSYPNTLVNNQNVCNEGSSFATNQTCDISGEGVSPGEHTLDFERISSSFDYQIRYDARAVSGFVNVDINNDNERFSRSTAEAQEWNDVRSTSLLERGENNVSIESEIINGIQTESTATIQYSIDTGVVQSPEIMVTNGEGETYNVEIPDSSLDSSDQLVDNADISIPQEWLTVGENNIEIKTEDGVFELYGNILIDENNIRFETNN